MSQRGRIKQIVERTDTRAGQAFDLVVQGLIVLSLIGFAVETLPDLPRWLPPILAASEVLIVLLFTVEYLLRVAVADRRTSFIFSFFGIIDLLAILPFYLTTGLDLRSLRALRLIRLFRILKVARYSAALWRLRLAFRAAREELVLFLTASLIVMYIAAVGIYYFENPVQPEAFASVFHAMWWALTTLTTVGYGDVYPITAGGRTFTGLVLLVGLGVVAVPAGIMASALAEARRQSSELAASSVPQPTATGTPNDDQT
jgi:voltage-gated potassium channel